MMPGSPKKHAVLFISNGVFGLSYIAKILAEQFDDTGMRFNGTCIKARPIHPEAADVLRDNGFPPPPVNCDRFHELEPYQYDLIITLGDSSHFSSRELPAMLPRFHWEMADGSSLTLEKGNQHLIKAAMKSIQKNLETLFNSDFLNTLFIARRHQQLILDNMLDGVMAHSEKRTIFFLNRAAESITGLKRDTILGKDCHDVFPGRFCGGACDYCDGPLSEPDGSKDGERKRVEFKTRDGQKKILEMVTLPLTDEVDENIGALLLFKDVTELENMKNHIRHHHSLGRLVTKDPKMLAVFEQIKEVARVQAPVLIIGESGTGKELVANAIHELSPRVNKPFVAVNCGALPEGILESELFGHEKGAFTGAISEKKGRFELAEKGTLFLDEVAELSPAMQVKLLRALQEKCFERVGGEKLIHVDIRIVSATNQDLKQLMKEKRFRRDLYYRLCVVPIELPPLRDRRMDIPVLVEHFLDLVAEETERSVLGYTTEAMDALSAYAWPGNVRELRNAMEYAYVKSRENVIRLEHLPPEITTNHRTNGKKTGPPPKIEKDRVIDALAQTNGNRKEAASLLGIGRATLYRYLDQYALK